MADPASAPPIDYCIRDHPLMRFQVKVSLRMRGKMGAAMPLQSGMTFLEVGTTPDTTYPDQNFFSKRAHEMGCRVSVTSIEDCSQMAQKNGFRWIPMPSLDKNSSERFDYVLSAAVLEHLRGEQGKLDHLRFLDRLSSRFVVITIPNRGHWLEVHTKLPLIHWLPNSIHRSILRLIGMRQWADPSHMDLPWFSEFHRLVNTVFTGHRIQFKKFRFLGPVSNVMAIVEKTAR